MSRRDSADKGAPSADSAGNRRLDEVVAAARRAREERLQGYREQALKLFPWVCGRCARVFDQKNLRELTVHHKDGNHDNNPADGSNWELLCLYCHDNEHRRYEDFTAASGSGQNLGTQGQESTRGTHRPFSDLLGLLKKE